MTKSEREKVVPIKHEAAVLPVGQPSVQAIVCIFVLVSRELEKQTCRPVDKSGRLADWLALESPKDWPIEPLD